jgi:hypothetical protein
VRTVVPITARLAIAAWAWGGAFERQALADDPTDDPFGQQLKPAFVESTSRVVVEAPLDPTTVTAR